MAAHSLPGHSLSSQTNCSRQSIWVLAFLAALRPSVVRSLAKGTYEPALIEAWATAAINAAWQAMQFQRDLACLARRAAVMDRGIDARLCETGSTANRARLRRRRSGSWDTRRATRLGRRPREWLRQPAAVRAADK